MKPTVGRIVHYKLRKEDAEAINRRRTTGTNIACRLSEIPARWPIGAQAHIGNSASQGDVLPLIISRVWPNEFGPDVDGVNGQVFLDGNDTLWVTSIREGQEEGQYKWPTKVE